MNRTRKTRTRHRRSESRRFARSRGGISLVEVLMSIGVVSIGLIGVLALVPVGAHQAEVGAVLDRVTLIAEEAYDELNMRQLSRMDPRLVDFWTPDYVGKKSPIEINNLLKSRWFFPQDDKDARFRWLASVEDHTVHFDDPQTLESPDIPAVTRQQYPANVYRVRVEVFYQWKDFDSKNMLPLSLWNPYNPESFKQNKPKGTFRRPVKLGPPVPP